MSGSEQLRRVVLEVPDHVYRALVDLGVIGKWAVENKVVAIQEGVRSVVPGQEASGTTYRFVTPGNRWSSGSPHTLEAPKRKRGRPRKNPDVEPTKANRRKARTTNNSGLEVTSGLTQDTCQEAPQQQPPQQQQQQEPVPQTTLQDLRSAQAIQHTVNRLHEIAFMDDTRFELNNYLASPPSSALILSVPASRAPSLPGSRIPSLPGSRVPSLPGSLPCSPRWLCSSIPSSPL